MSPSAQFEQVLRSQLRTEAQYLKDCFTKHSFQAMTLVALVLPALLAATRYVPIASVGSFFLIILMATVCRMGAFKYASANRLYGYELHLDRTLDIDYGKAAEGQGAWAPEMRMCGWELAQRAWRIVQATLFDDLYYTPSILSEIRTRLRRQAKVRYPELSRIVQYALAVSRIHLKYGQTSLIRNTIRSRHRRNLAAWLANKPFAQYPWFLPDRIARAKGASYHAGSYLQRVYSVSRSMSWLSLSPVVYGMVESWRQEKFLTLISLSVVLFAGTCVLRVVWRSLLNRRILLESGFLSIHACGVVWQAVVLAHFRARNEDPNRNYGRYAENLVKQATGLRRRLYSIQNWVRGA